jgi:hypothetical protein
MQKHRMFITSATIFILLSCFSSQSEGRSFCPLDKIFGGLLFNEWRADNQHPLINPLYRNVQYREAGNHIPFCGISYHFFFYAEISCIPEKRYVFSKLNQYIRTSQRPPPLSYEQRII